MALVDLLGFPHFWVMLIGIVLLTISVILVITHKPEKWFLLHKLFAVAGIVLALIGIIALSGLNLSILHGIFGLIIFIWLTGEIVGGYIASKKKDKTMRKVHLQLGRLVFILALVALLFGILTIA